MWHDAYVLITIMIAVGIVGVLAAVVVVAAGRGGEMPMVERTDYAPLDMGPVSATDVVLLRPQMALWGYTQQMVDEALDRIADSIRERDVRIVALEQLVTDLSRQPVVPMPLGSPYAGARHARTQPNPALQAQPDGGEEPLEAQGPVDARDPGAPGPREAYGPMGTHGPMAAPVADNPGYPGRPSPDAPPWASGTGWPPEVSHD